jgi:hypothetical protein
MNRESADLIGPALPIVKRGHHDDNPFRKRAAQGSGSMRRLEVDAERIGADGQLRAVLLKHADGQYEHRSVTVEGIYLRRSQISEIMNPSGSDLGGGCSTSCFLGGRSETQR